MHPDFSLLSITRQNILGLCANYSLEQLNRIPSGFNNNLIWNAAHVVVTQHLLTYGLCGQAIPLSTDFVQAYRKGSRPQGTVDATQWAFIQAELEESLNRLEADWEQLSALSFKPYPSSYGVTLHSLEEAFIFNQTHEAMHFGTMLALRKLV
ncbi:MAG: DinB family protein [Bacteroidota bacterium]